MRQKAFTDFIININVTIKWLINSVICNFPTFIRRYNKQLIYEHRVFNVRGLRTKGTFTIELQQVFVDLRIASTHNLQHSNFDPISLKELSGTRPLWDFLRSDKGNKNVLAIVGAPGCGKTTMLQHIALTLAANKQRKYRFLPLAPIMLFLRNHFEQILSNNQDPLKNRKLNLAELAYDHFSNQENYPNLNPPQEWFAKKLKKGQCLVLFDGLDEVADTEDRKKVSIWIETQIATYPRCHFIITARPQGYLSAPVKGAQMLEVQAFNSAQVRQFVKAWYYAHEVTSFGGKIDDGVHQRAMQGAKDLLQRLRENPTLSVLTVNPLLLTMIAMVHRYRGQLPGRRVELYAEICDVLLGHWAASKGIRNSLTPAQKRVILQPLAFQMMRYKIRNISTENAMKIIALPLERVGLTGEATEHFLSDIQTGSGLLLEQEPNKWGFAHLTFQEYLAAAHILENQIKINWNNSVNNSWWYETFLLYAAVCDATKLVKGCLENGSISALTLAANCLDEARSLDWSVREELQNRITADLESSEIQRRHLAAEVHLNQRIKYLQHIDEDIDIDLKYITHAEYQLFLDESRMQGKYYQPDHWTENVFPKGTAQTPISGVRAEDAEAFCQWLSQRRGGGISYRLPLPKEANEYPADISSKEFAAWCKNNNAYQLNWMTEVEEQRIDFFLRKFSSLPFSKQDTLPSSKKLMSQLEHADSAINYALGHALSFVRTQALERAINLAFSRDFSNELASALIRNALDKLVAAFNTLDELPPPHSDSYGYAQSSAKATISRAFSNSSAIIDSVSFEDNNLVHDALTLTHEILEKWEHKQANRVREALSTACNALDRDFVRNLLLAHARVLARADASNTIFTLIEKNDFEKAQQLVQAKQGESKPSIQRLGAMLDDLLSCAIAKTLLELRQAWRKYVVRITETIWVGYNEKLDYSEEITLILNLHWHLKIVIAREEEQLHAWEGIRIVREQSHL
jgi:energy-coupling factor transporter ATP-binding protein EcfA2